LFGTSCKTPQERKKDYRGAVFAQLEVFEMKDGLPGASSKSTSPVGGLFRLDATREKDTSGKQACFRTIDGRSRWLQTNTIEVALDINENGEMEIPDYSNGRS
jgi:hypothetical protein